jgi:hypothetical protein
MVEDKELHRSKLPRDTDRETDSPVVPPLSRPWWKKSTIIVVIVVIFAIVALWTAFLIWVALRMIGQLM